MSDFALHQPSAWALLLLPVVLLALLRARRLRRRSAVRFSAASPLAAAGTTWATRVRWVVPALRAAALVLLVVAIARPRTIDERARIPTEGIAIELVIDRSGSMLAQDFALEGRRVDRLAAVRAVVEEFVLGGDDLPGRPNDVVGLVTFATWADATCPPTLDHEHLVAAVRATEVSPSDEDRHTALGDAIALGLERLRSLEERAVEEGGSTIRGKVMIVLTDGESNAGDIDPLTAAEMARAFDVRIYTIGAGSDAAAVPVPATDPFTGRTRLVAQRVSIDEETLRAIAERTGGSYQRATDTDSLADIYARIDALERTEIADEGFVAWRELAVAPTRLGGTSIPPILALVIALLALETLLATTRLRSFA